MISIALYEPEIPPNTGNIIRLCANTGVDLHLIHPLGFSPDSSKLKRAGLDYHEWTRVFHHENYIAFLKAMQNKKIYACTTHGKFLYSEVKYAPGDVFLFGPETRGLPKDLLSEKPSEQLIRIPMLQNSRSLNLSNAAAVITYEALRQIGFAALSLK